jgi:hypothetical protein
LTLVTGLFSPVPLLNQRRSPTLTLQFHTAALPVLCAMFPVQLYFVLILLCFLLSDISFLRHCHIYQYICFLFFVLNYYIWPICRNFSLSLSLCLFHNSIALPHLLIHLLVYVCMRACLRAPASFAFMSRALHIG